MSTQTVQEFYRRVVKSLDLLSDERGFIWAGNAEEKTMVNSAGKPLVIPTKEHIANMYGKDDAGNIVEMHALYNPLAENSLKGDSDSIKKTKLFAEQRLGYSIWAAGMLLLNVAHDVKLQKKTNLHINKFLSAINAANNIGVKELVDEKSIQYWENLYDKILERQGSLVNIYLKKSATHEGTKYNRLASAVFPLYDELMEATKDSPVEGIKLRNKDITIFKIIFDFVLDLEGKTTYAIGSNDTECPTFIALMKLYLTLIKSSNRVIEELKNVNAEIYDSAHIDIEVELDELDSLGIYKSDLALIPDTNMAPKNQTVEQIAPVAQPVAPAIPTVGNIPTVEKPLPMNAGPTDPVENILTNSGFYQRQQMMQAMNPMMNINIPTVQQPMIQQPVIQQPMIQQPMLNQPMLPNIGMGMGVGMNPMLGGNGYGIPTPIISGYYR